MNTDEATSLQLLEVHRGARFPVTATEAGLPQWDEAAAAGAAGAKEASRWASTGDDGAASADDASGQHELAPELRRHLLQQVLQGGGAHAPGAVGRRRGDDGVDVLVTGPALDARSRGQLLGAGGGLLVPVDGTSPVLDRMAGQLAVAWAAPVGVHALHGSEPTRALGLQVARTCVAPLDHDVIVHPDGGAPFDLPAGRAATVAGAPRILAPDAGATTVLFAERAFDATARKAVLDDRARFHPVLRLDSPLPGSGPVEVYGLDEPVDYAELVAAELAALLASSPVDHLRRWWAWDQALAPVALPDTDSLVVRGRFPGGVGVLERGELTAIRCAGTNLAVPDGALDLVTHLLSGRPLPVGGADGVPTLTGATAALLASVGLVEAVSS